MQYLYVALRVCLIFCLFYRCAGVHWSFGRHKGAIVDLANAEVHLETWREQGYTWRLGEHRGGFEDLAITGVYLKTLRAQEYTWRI